jgi:16S rRNA (cytidine1402-2'-O)-methyltransferase
MAGKLFVVSTPIGNLSDITLRALETLKSVDMIACEDTRHTLQLLNHFEIKKSLISYHQYSKIGKIEQIISTILDNKDVAIVTDAGTPGISDPGEILIHEAIKNKIEVVPIPGVSAAITALSVSGLPTDEFVFIGFLPHKKGRQTKLKELATLNRTIILYESPFRIIKLLNELLEFVGDRDVAVCRELTKKFEEIYRGKISEVLPEIKEKGEFVVILSPLSNDGNEGAI